MKTDYIYNMPAGEELDILVAEKVMAFTISKTDLHGRPGNFVTYNKGVTQICYSVPHYSTNISEAWRIVEKMGPYKLESMHNSEKSWHKATFWRGMVGFPVNADTVPLAICRSALLAMTYKLD